MTMSITLDDIQAILRTIDDPEMPISIVDLGMVESVEVSPTPQGHHVVVTLLPTFVGCPALPVLEQTVGERVGNLPGVNEVEVRFVFAPPWSVDRISDAGRESLRRFGITVPHNGQTPLPANLLRPQTIPLGLPNQTPHMQPDDAHSNVPCPFCRSHNTRLESPFGPTRCRMIYYCTSCKNSFEHMKRI